jgi:prolyl-tRNA synthetase
MRMSKLFSQTLRDVPSEAEIPSHQLLLRAGFIRQLAAGVFSYLPLARRSLSKIEAILRQEIEAIGGQEISMPVVQPAEIWKESRRWHLIDAEMGRFQDRSGRDMVLAMTHEEALADIVRREVRSYRQLPQLVYHIQTKWRDDPRPRAGLIRAREFTMKDSYSLDGDADGLDRQYRNHYQAYFNIFRRCGLPVIAVGADVGMMGGYLAHEFMYLTPVGEDTLLLCENCDYASNRQIAAFRKEEPPAEQALPIEKVATPNAKTIEGLANFLNVPKSKTAKAVFLIASPNGKEPEAKPFFVFAIIRGDMEVNETKLANALAARSLRPATEEEILATGAAPGYASPVGLQREDSQIPVTVIVDDMIPASPNLVAGANEAGYHLRNVNYGRDFEADIVTDIASAQEGDACPRCGGVLHAQRGVEVGNIFKLGTRFSDEMGCTFLDAQGEPQPVIMGSYGIGLGRLLASVAEAHHDEHGLIWPVSVAPYLVHLVLLAGKNPQSEEQTLAEQLYTQLTEAGVEVLYDDREASPGVKFNDADLIGVPIRLTISRRASQAGGVEFKRRDQAERRVVELEDVPGAIQATIAELQDELNSQLTPVEFKD